MGGEARLHAIPGGGGQESSTAAVHVLLGTIERLRQVVEAETLTLKENKPADLRDFNVRKNQGLLELTRAMRGIATDGLGHEASERLRCLRVALQRNSEVLKTHVDAVQEICAMMAGAIQEAESDGTYTIASRRRDAR
ncbi:MAG TPA: hypothetical protein VN240_13595 [Propylenella sp.]|nr:hypothetical protein [Propylenella sp.]